MYGKPNWNFINNIKKSCEFCGKQISLGNYKRWHGENCKHRIK